MTAYCISGYLVGVGLPGVNKKDEDRETKYREISVRKEMREELRIEDGKRRENKIGHIGLYILSSFWAMNAYCCPFNAMRQSLYSY